MADSEQVGLSGAGRGNTSKVRGGIRGRGRRGRGGKSASSSSSSSAAAAAAAAVADIMASPSSALNGGGNGVAKRAPARRGRFKQYDTPRLQATSERKLAISAAYRRIASFMKDALTEIADHETDKLKLNRDYHKTGPQYEVVMSQLDSRRDKAASWAESELQFRLKDAHKSLELNNQISTNQHENVVEEAEHQFVEATLRRLDILEFLHDHKLPLDVLDEDYAYTNVATNHQFGPHRHCNAAGIFVPEPCHVKGSKEAEEYKKAKAAVLEARSKGKVVTRRAARLQAAQPVEAGPAEQASDDEDGGFVAPVHSRGLLASENIAAASRENAPADDDEADPRQKMPGLPRGASEPDAFGFRTVQNGRSGGGGNRIIAPQTCRFEDHEIGFRDSTNSSRQRDARASRGILLDKPNSTTFHWDPTLASGADCRLYKKDTLNQKLVDKHKLHPSYGFFTPDSANDSEPSEPLPYSATRPRVFIDNSGHTVHATRSTIPYKLDHHGHDRALRKRMAHSLDGFCKKQKIDDEDITAGDEIDFLHTKSLGIHSKLVQANTRLRKQREAALSKYPLPEPIIVPDVVVEGTPSETPGSPRDHVDVDVNDQDKAAEELHVPSPVAISGFTLDALLRATTSTENDTWRPATPEGARNTPQYDAIRDVFQTTVSHPEAPRHEPSQPKPSQSVIFQPPRTEATGGLNLLSQLCCQQSPLNRTLPSRQAVSSTEKAIPPTHNTDGQLPGGVDTVEVDSPRVAPPHQSFGSLGPMQSDQIPGPTASETEQASESVAAWSQATAHNERDTIPQHEHSVPATQSIEARIFVPHVAQSTEVLDAPMPAPGAVDNNDMNMLFKFSPDTPTALGDNCDNFEDPGPDPNNSIVIPPSPSRAPSMSDEGIPVDPNLFFDEPEQSLPPHPTQNERFRDLGIDPTQVQTTPSQLEKPRQASPQPQPTTQPQLAQVVQPKPQEPGKQIAPSTSTLATLAPAPPSRLQIEDVFGFKLRPERPSVSGNKGYSSTDNRSRQPSALFSPYHPYLASSHHILSPHGHHPVSGPPPTGAHLPMSASTQGPQSQYAPGPYPPQPGLGATQSPQYSYPTYNNTHPPYGPPRQYSSVTGNASAPGPPPTHIAAPVPSHAHTPSPQPHAGHAAPFPPPATYGLHTSPTSPSYTPPPASQYHAQGPYQMSPYTQWAYPPPNYYPYYPPVTYGPSPPTWGYQPMSPPVPPQEPPPPATAAPRGKTPSKTSGSRGQAQSQARSRRQVFGTPMKPTAVQPLSSAADGFRIIAQAPWKERPDPTRGMRIQHYNPAEQVNKEYQAKPHELNSGKPLNVRFPEDVAARRRRKKDKDTGKDSGGRDMDSGSRDMNFGSRDLDYGDRDMDSDNYTPANEGQEFGYQTRSATNRDQSSSDQDRDVSSEPQVAGGQSQDGSR